MTLQDSGTATPEGYHLKNSVSIWTRGGRKLVDAPFYVSCIEAMKPDVFQMLSDGDYNINSSSKRLKKSVDATVKFASICANLREKCDVLWLILFPVKNFLCINLKKRNFCIFCCIRRKYS